MCFSLDGRRFVLRGAEPSGIKLINNKTFTHVVHKSAQMCFLYMDNSINHFEVPACTVDSSPKPEHSIPMQIQDLIVEFADIFEDPKHLPPPRPGFDHKIPLKGSAPFNLCPYRYSI